MKNARRMILFFTLSAAALQACYLYVLFIVNWDGESLAANENTRIALSLGAALLLGCAIFFHFRSKNIAPFRQWQVYVFPVLAYFISVLGLAITPLAMKYLQEQETIDGQVREHIKALNFLPWTGGTLGLVGGLIADASAMAGAGDAAIGPPPCAIMGCLAGGVAGIALKELRAVIVLKTNKIPFFLALLGSILLSGLLYGAWSGEVHTAQKLRSGAAAAALKNCRTMVEAYYADHQQYPLVFADAKCDQSADIVFSPEKMTKTEYVLVCYRRDTNIEYMAQSDTSNIFVREKDSGKKWEAY